MTRGRRWDFLYDEKPVPLVDHVVEEISKVLAPELAQWPLPVQDLDLATGADFEGLLEHDSPQPGPQVFQEAFRLARWELAREFEAGDDYVRNRRYLGHGVNEAERIALFFIKRWLEEQMLALLDATAGRITRKDLVRSLEVLERRALELRSPAHTRASPRRAGD